MKLTIIPLLPIATSSVLLLHPCALLFERKMNAHNSFLFPVLSDSFPMLLQLRAPWMILHWSAKGGEKTLLPHTNENITHIQSVHHVYASNSSNSLHPLSASPTSLSHSHSLSHLNLALAPRHLSILLLYLDSEYFTIVYKRMTGGTLALSDFWSPTPWHHETGPPVWGSPHTLAPNGCRWEVPPWRCRCLGKVPRNAHHT